MPGTDLAKTLRRVAHARPPAGRVCGRSGLGRARRGRRPPDAPARRADARGRRRDGHRPPLRRLMPPWPGHGATGSALPSDLGQTSRSGRPMMPASGRPFIQRPSGLVRLMREPGPRTRTPPRPTSPSPWRPSRRRVSASRAAVTSRAMDRSRSGHASDPKISVTTASQTRTRLAAVRPAPLRRREPPARNPTARLGCAPRLALLPAPGPLGLVQGGRVGRVPEAQAARADALDHTLDGEDLDVVPRAVRKARVKLHSCATLLLDGPPDHVEPAPEPRRALAPGSEPLPD